jgi:hypothetical protein
MGVNYTIVELILSTYPSKTEITHYILYPSIKQYKSKIEQAGIV